jgi:integrase
MKMFDTMAADPQATADVKIFSAMRDYLLLRVMMASGQRCGAASNLNIQEYADGIWTESDGSLS